MDYMHLNVYFQAAIFNDILYQQFDLLKLYISSLERYNMA